jgi:hypothetical protein
MTVVQYERRGAVAVVTMNRPEYRNAQNSAMAYALDAAFTRAVDDEVAVIVLAGAGEHFSAGTTSAVPAGTWTPRSSGSPCCGGTTSARRAATSGTSGRWRSTWAGADGGGRCPSPPSRWCRARASRAG